MPITTSSDGTIIATGKGVEVFRLLAIKSSLKLEKIGLRHSRGSVRAYVRKMEGAPKTKDIDKLIEFIEVKIQEARSEDVG